MGILKRLRESVQQITKLADRLTPAEAKLVSDLVIGISESQSVLLSNTARVVNAIEGKTEDRDLIRTEQRLSKGLSRARSGLDELADAWVRHAAPTVRKMPFVTVDGSEVTKPYGGTFENLAHVRDSSAPGKPIKPGYWTVNIEANDGQGHHVPLVLDIFSTKDPAYAEKGDDAWKLTFQEGMRRVLPAVAEDATWLLDRGFDDNDVFHFLGDELRRKYVVRLKRNRNILVGDLSNPITANVEALAFGLKKPHTVNLPYINKHTHQPRTFAVSFNYVPIRLPNVSGEFYLFVITGTLGDDWLLLSNRRPRNPKQAGRIVCAYLARWGNEEMTRLWKQCADAEDFRVRTLRAIRRLLFLSMIAMGIQSLWSAHRPGVVKQLIARVKHFIQDVQFHYYRLWEGTADALIRGD